nr:[protein-PII] uridylyltransferase [Kangiella sp. HZ709]
MQALIEQFQKGISVNQLLKARSALIDNILIQSWQQYSVSEGCSLIAVGGYGRQELQPYSDIDILILVNEDSCTKKLEAWIAFLWDIGLEVGHSVRGISDCNQLAEDDLTIATSLMESRYLCGQKDAFDELQLLLQDIDFWPSKVFYKAKVKEHRLRHKKFEDSSYNLEPNIKSNPGGLRDIQVIQWIALRQFNSKSLHDLISQQIFTRREYKTLISHQQFLRKVRFALHAIAGKREDRLSFEHQKQVALWLGYEDDKKKLAVEYLMQRYYRSVMAIRNLAELFIQIFEQDYLLEQRLEAQHYLDEDFYIENNRIGTKNEELFKEKPEALITIFNYLAEAPKIKQIQAKTLRLIRSSQQIINKDYLLSQKNKDAWLKFLSTKQVTSRGFALMKRTNILGALIREFAQIEGQMQFDLFHAYTVDEHTLFLLRHIIRYNKPDCQEEFPICSQIMQELNDPSPIYLAAIFHDIGKGRGGDHSELGAVDAYEYCIKLGLTTQQAELVSWLVKNHLVMSLIAQRKDISDPDVIETFAKRLPSHQHLELLYVLTVSDIRATNPTLWNSWKASLLKELFLATSYYLRQSSPRANQQEMLQDARQQVIAQSLHKGASEQALQKLLNALGDEYLLRYHPEQIIWQLEQLLNRLAYSSEQPYVAIKNHRSKAGTEVFIAINDQPNLFATIVSVLSQNQMNIQAATLFTSPKGYCLDTFIVLDSAGQPLSNNSRLKEIESKLVTALEQPNKAFAKVARSIPSRYKHFNVPTKVEFGFDKANKLTILELTALDRPALLVNIAQAFKDCNLKIHSAKIVTLGEKVEDTFIISNLDLSPLNPEQEQKLEQLIIRYIES